MGILVFMLSFLIYENRMTYEEQEKKGSGDYYPFLSNGDPIREILNRTWIAGENYTSNFCTAVELDSLGNIYLGGYLYNNVTDDREIALVKYDKNGVYQWNRTWNIIGSHDYCHDIAIDSSDNVYIGGSTYNQKLLLIKYTQNGVRVWNRTLPFFISECQAIAIDSYDNIVLTGTIDKFDAKQTDILLLVYNSSGVEQWNRTWGGNEFEHGNGIVIDSLDNIYITGDSNNSICLVKFNSSGVEQWNSTWGVSGYNRGEDIALDSSNNIFVAGTIVEDICLLKFNNLGVVQWNRTWGSFISEVGKAVLIDSSDNVYIIGHASSYVCIVKYSNLGMFHWDLIYNSNDFEQCWDAAIDSLGYCYLAGFRRTGFNVVDYYIIKVKLHTSFSYEISFGNYFLFLILIGVISASFFTKRKVIK